METLTPLLNGLTVVGPSMEPPPFSDGNPISYLTYSTCRQALQWSHRLSAMETPSRQRGESRFRSAFNGATAFRQWKPTWRFRPVPLACPRFNGATAFRQWKLTWRVSACSFGVSSLQWGHRLSAVETKPQRLVGSGILAASMGPPPFGSGNVKSYPFRNVCSTASMGPPPFGSGNVVIERNAGGRALLLQWGHRLSAVETINAEAGTNFRGGFNGATAFQQWKPGTIRIRATNSAGFNGATAFQQWKHDVEKTYHMKVYALQWGHRLSAVETGGRGHRAGHTAPASMGPPPFSSGNRWTWPPGWPHSSRFNGATAFQQWKRGLPHRHRPASTASMGPPPFSSGNNPFHDFYVPNTLGLQWGHRLSAVETRIVTCQNVAPFHRFNGATAFQQWKPLGSS